MAKVQLDGVGNFPGGNIGNAEWTLKGHDLTGRVVNGNQGWGSFQGAISGTGADGVFVMPDGTQVKWTWVPDSPGTGNGAPKSAGKRQHLLAAIVGTEKYVARREGMFRYDLVLDPGEPGVQRVSIEQFGAACQRLGIASEKIEPIVARVHT